jgi:phosphoribosylformimino-5-aminoimidazole carboxamide ribotide isomerase
VELYPAIDLLGGRCVRLEQGDVDRSTAYGDPVATAEELVARGARRLHVVDLDAARTGRPENRRTVEAIVSAAGVPVQAGGGMRSRESAEELLGAGVARVVVGTAALESPAMVADLARDHAGRIAVGLDHRGGVLAVRGWTSGSGTRLEEALGRLEGTGVAAVVVTDISRDGMLAGPDLDGLEGVLRATSIGVVASGGVRSAQDVRALARLSAGRRALEGVIVGKAIHEGLLSVEEAVAACAA